MAMLISGVLVFGLVHLVPALMPRQREQAIARLGRQPYRGIFSLLVGAGLVLMIFGWSAARPAYLYRPVLAADWPAALIMLTAFVLFLSSQLPTHIGRSVRHPMLLGVLLWSLVHLLANGDSRSVVLFGGLGAWAGMEIVLCMLRETGRTPAGSASAGADAAAVLIGAAVFAAIAYGHAWIFGVSALSGV